MRRSISGPLILMTVGVLFLLNNFYPDIFSFHSLFLYWPFLLIGLGVIRLIEVFVVAGSAQPLPASRISGGGIVGIVIICMIVGAVSKGARSHWRGPMPFVHLDPMSMFGEQFDFNVEQNLPVSPADTRLLLEGMRGNVTITGDDSNAVTVSGHRTIHAYGQSAANQANSHTHIDLVRSGNDIILRSTRAGASDDSSIAYDIDIKVPRRMSLGNQSTVENVTAEGLDGGVDISAATGNVRLTSIGGDARIETTRRKDLIRAVGIKGKLDVRGTGNDVQIEDVQGQVTIHGTYFGTLDFRNLLKPLHFESEQTDLRVEKLPGSISMDLADFRAENVDGPLHITCKSRDIHISNFSSELEVNVDRGDVELNPQRTPLAKMDVHVRAGDVDLTVPERAPFDLRANTTQGDTDNQLGSSLTTTSEGRSSAMKSTAIGGPPITITTDRGNITVKKS